MRGKHHHAARFYFGGDFFADLLEFAVCGVVVLVHDIGLDKRFRNGNMLSYMGGYRRGVTYSSMA